MNDYYLWKYMWNIWMIYIKIYDIYENIWYMKYMTWYIYVKIYDIWNMYDIYENTCEIYEWLLSVKSHRVIVSK